MYCIDGISKEFNIDSEGMEYIFLSDEGKNEYGTRHHQLSIYRPTNTRNRFVLKARNLELFSYLSYLFVVFLFLLWRPH